MPTSRWRSASTGAVVALGALVLAAVPAVAAPPTGTVLASEKPVPGSYLVMLRPAVTASATTVQDLASTYGGEVTARWQHALQGFATQMDEAEAKRLAADPRVASVQQDSWGSISETQVNPPAWGLDRIDQRTRPLDSRYHFSSKANPVHAYVLDTGIRTTHQSFGGRASWGTDVVDGSNVDCNGHGTHVAGTIGGSDFGVAKDVRLVAVRVINCSGNGTTAQAISGIDWVTQNAVKPAVANMSLQYPPTDALDNAVRNSINSGVNYAVAATNFGADACTRSPARVAEALTVGATDATDTKANFSSFGSCVDLFAPGVGILSASNGSDTASATLSGTSMATPHVAGAVAQWLTSHATDAPAQVAAGIIGASTPNLVTNPGANSPNRLLYNGSFNEPVAANMPDVTGDRRTDLTLVGGQGWTTIPVAQSRGDGTFTVTNAGTPDFPQWAQAPGVTTVAGDFNADGSADQALLGGPGWNTIPVAMSRSNGTFTVTNASSPDFAGWAQVADVKIAAADFNVDGRTDLALLPGPNTPWWFTIPVAFSNGNGTFTVTNTASRDFAAWSQAPGVRLSVGDFNADGRADLSLLPGPNTPWWFTVPIAFSKGDGNFTITNTAQNDFAAWAQAPGTRVTTGDFNADGRADLSLLPGPNTPWWFTIPIAFSKGDGNFTITNTAQNDFAAWAQAPGARVLSGDFNGDKRVDIALVPGPNTSWWFTVPIAFSKGDGTFTITNTAQNDFAAWAQAPGVRASVGDFNGDGKADINLLPGANTPWWFTIPVAHSKGDGNFTVTNTASNDFASWIQHPGARLVATLGK